MHNVQVEAQLAEEALQQQQGLGADQLLPGQGAMTATLAMDEIATPANSSDPAFPEATEAAAGSQQQADAAAAQPDAASDAAAAAVSADAAVDGGEGSCAAGPDYVTDDADWDAADADDALANDDDGLTSNEVRTLRLCCLLACAICWGRGSVYIDGQSSQGQLPVRAPEVTLQRLLSQ